MPRSDLDAIDRRIVSALQADGRLSNVELADKVGLSPSPCLRRVRRLEREGYIDGYRAALRRDRVGLGLSVFVGGWSLIAAEPVAIRANATKPSISGIDQRNRRALHMKQPRQDGHKHFAASLLQTY